MDDPRDTPELTSAFTVIFPGDIRKFAENPLGATTPFGVSIAVGMGNAFDEIERLQREIRYLRQYGNKDCTHMADAAMENNELEN